ncbi:hypothetical protein BDZ45DRAFT_279182 [Acephala macrosclerotiorum]|nr:hypothetical protein BDZ45DRAFT_279182 [Acephala macrosclerotiorum]
MAPKASQSSRGNSQESKLKDAFKKLCEILSSAKQTEGFIKSTNTLNALNEILRAYRKNGKLISASTIIELAGALENEDGDLCSNIEPALFITILQATLQAEHGLEGERILHLLAGSLLRDANASRNGVELAWVAGRKATIGKECLQPILYYFLNQENSANLRRWVRANDKLCMTVADTVLRLVYCASNWFEVATPTYKD